MKPVKEGDFGPVLKTKPPNHEWRKIAKCTFVVTSPKSESIKSMALPRMTQCCFLCSDMCLTFLFRCGPWPDIHGATPIIFLYLNINYLLHRAWRGGMESMPSPVEQVVLVHNSWMNARINQDPSTHIHQGIDQNALHATSAALATVNANKQKIQFRGLCFREVGCGAKCKFKKNVHCLVPCLVFAFVFLIFPLSGWMFPQNSWRLTKNWSTIPSKSRQWCPGALPRRLWKF